MRSQGKGAPEQRIWKGTICENQHAYLDLMMLLYFLPYIISDKRGQVHEIVFVDIWPIPT